MTFPKVTMGSHSSEDKLFEAFTLTFEELKLSQMTCDDLLKLASLLKKLLDVLHRRNQPYNLLIRDHRLHIIPR